VWRTSGANEQIHNEPFAWPGWQRGGLGRASPTSPVPLQNNEACHNRSLILLGSNLPPLNIPTSGTISHLDPSGYNSILQHKLLELREVAESNTVEAASRQKWWSESLELQVEQKVIRIGAGWNHIGLDPGYSERVERTPEYEDKYEQ